jgi:hypothetical protein
MIISSVRWGITHDVNGQNWICSREAVTAGHESSAPAATHGPARLCYGRLSFDLSLLWLAISPVGVA